jgi:hypothetical protein
MCRHVLLGLVLLGLASGLEGQAPPQAPVGPPSTADLTAALRDTAPGWFAFRSDGTARSDSARRMAALGLWDLEGGDRERGLRLVHAAQELGVADSLFYVQAGLALSLVRADDEASAVYAESTTKWPNAVWAWTGWVPVLQRLGRHADAEAARKRVALLRRSF